MGRVTSELVPILVAIKELHREIENLRKEICDLRDTVSTMGSAPHSIQITMGGVESDAENEADIMSVDSSDESENSTQSAPAVLH